MIFLEQKKCFLFKIHGSHTVSVPFLFSNLGISQSSWHEYVSMYVYVGSQLHKNLFKHLDNCKYVCVGSQFHKNLLNS